MKLHRLILKKIIKIVATRCQILRLKCTKFDFGWGSAPDPTGRAYSAPPDTLAGFQGSTSKGTEGKEGEGGEGKTGEGRYIVLVWKCIHGRAPAYLSDLCRPLAGIPGRRQLRSSSSSDLLVPRSRTATGQRAFAIYGQRSGTAFQRLCGRRSYHCSRFGET